MTLEEYKIYRREKMKKLQEKLSNMPEAPDDKVHGEVDAVELDAIISSDKADENKKEALKEKNKLVKEFIKDQDKGRDIPEEEKSENRLILDESLFEGYDVREFSDLLIEYMDNGTLDPYDIACDLIFYCSEDDIKDFMIRNGYYDEDIEEDNTLEEI